MEDEPLVEYCVSAGYGDYAMVFNLRASVGSEHNIRGQQYIGFEFTIVVHLMWVHLTVKSHG